MKKIHDIGVMNINVKINMAKRRIDEYKERIILELQGRTWNNIHADTIVQQAEGIMEELVRIKELSEVLEMLEEVDGC